MSKSGVSAAVIGAGLFFTTLLPSFVNADAHIRIIPITIDPALAGKTFISNGEAFSVDDITEAYDKYQVDIFGQPSPIVFHSKGLIFRTDDGTVYIAGVYRESMIFTIHEFPVEEIERAINSFGKDVRKLPPELQERFPAMALAFQGGHGQTNLFKSWRGSVGAVRRNISRDGGLHNTIRRVQNYYDIRRKQGLEYPEKARAWARARGVGAKINF